MKKPIFLVTVWLVATSLPAAAQQVDSPSSHSSAVTIGAEQEADRLVSLSAEKIIEVLQEEPGLLLSVKRTLVHKAYEQGRILDSEELTDDAVFRLVREDENIRVIATREIEDRYYVRPKPNREEREQANLAQVDSQKISSSGSAELNTEQSPQGKQNREDNYWDRHDASNNPRSSPGPATQQDQPSNLLPTLPEENRGATDPRRQLQMADLDDPINQGIQPASEGMTRVHPDELAGLLMASDTASRLSTAANRSSRAGGTVPSQIPLESPQAASANAYPETPARRSRNEFSGD